MNLAETTEALALAQAYDRRTVGEADVRAWQAVLSDVPAADAMEAIRRHYRDSEAWLMPATVRRIAAEIQRERAVSPWAAGQYGVPREGALPEVSAAGRLQLGDLPAPMAELIARVRALAGEGSREALHPRRVAWEREHAAYRRQAAGEPNPLYDPAAAQRLQVMTQELDQ